jgi:F-type H+-transporting ATPase subunit a
MIHFKPLEQFTINIFFKVKLLFNRYFLFDYMDLMFLINLIIIAILNINNRIFVFKRKSFEYIQSAIHKFLKSILVSQLNFIGEVFFIGIIILFFTILVYNLLGMIPGFFCVTAQLGVALTLSCSIFFCVVFFIFYNCGALYFIKLFIPSGVPAVLLPLLFVLELISFISRVLSLAIRLFANMVAGHSLLHILSGAFTNILNTLKKFDTFLILLTIIPFIVILLVFFLELGIAFLQAYVFVMLSCIYLKDTLIYVAGKGLFYNWYKSICKGVENDEKTHN